MFLLNIATPWVRTGRHADYVTYYKPVRPNYIRHKYITMRKVMILVEALTLSALPGVWLVQMKPVLD